MKSHDLPAVIKVTVDCLLSKAGCQERMALKIFPCFHINIPIFEFENMWKIYEKKKFESCMEMFKEETNIEQDSMESLAATANGISALHCLFACCHIEAYKLSFVWTVILKRVYRSFQCSLWSLIAHISDYRRYFSKVCSFAHTRLSEFDHSFVICYKIRLLNTSVFLYNYFSTYSQSISFEKGFTLLI